LFLQSENAAAPKHWYPAVPMAAVQHLSSEKDGLGPPTRYPGGGPGVVSLTLPQRALL